jgi:hypothetical protein
MGGYAEIDKHRMSANKKSHRYPDKNVNEVHNIKL